MADKTPNNYLNIVAELKNKIRLAKTKAALSVNQELLKVYWEIGNTLLEQQKAEVWGSKVINRLAADLRSEFPEMKGLSERNLLYMRKFASSYQNLFTQQSAAQLQNADNQEYIKVQQAAAQLPWGHHQVILDRSKTIEEKHFYILKCAQNAWSRDVLVHQMESALHTRQGTLSNNFNVTLPNYAGELTQQLFKDPYNFDFLSLGEQAKERDLENALMAHVEKMLLELGEGFALMGRQKKLIAGDKEYIIDLLFYHTKLRRYIVIELKIGEFLPEYIGKMNLYLGLADDQLKGDYDEPSIGLILCKTKDKIVAEYALRDTRKPIGIAEYKINQLLPADIKGELPSIEEIEQKMDEELQQTISPTDARLKLIKEKLKSLKTEAIQTAVTYKILQDLFDNGIKPLFIRIINKMINDFAEDFYTQSASWTLDNIVTHDLPSVEAKWRKEEYLKSNKQIYFHYKLNGFKKGGANNFNEYLQLNFFWDEYYYSFTLNDSNNNQPVLKKMYHQNFSEEDAQLITNVLVDKVLDRIEWIIEHINNKK